MPPSDSALPIVRQTIRIANQDYCEIQRSVFKCREVPFRAQFPAQLPPVMPRSVATAPQSCGNFRGKIQNYIDNTYTNSHKRSDRTREFKYLFERDRISEEQKRNKYNDKYRKNN